jgi:hypothetical protein
MSTPAPDFVPRLRADLLVEFGPDSFVVTDPLLRRRLDLGGIGDVVAKLDGRPARALVADGARTEQILRTLLLLHMLDGAGEADRARLRTSLRASGGTAPELLPLVTLPGARFSCQGSGGCCRNYVFGPLTDADVARVEALDLAPFGLGAGPFYESRPTGERAERFLRTTDEGACVFLEPGQRCGLHARHGGASKPGFCQLFPIVAWQTVIGLRVYDGGECVSFPTSAGSGPSIEAAWEEVRALVPPPALHHPLVHLAPGAPCDLAWFLPVLDTMVARVADDAHPVDTLRLLGATFAAAELALRRCPITATGPQDALAAVFASPPPLSAPTRGVEGRAALTELPRALAQIFAAPLSQPGGRAPPFTREIVAALLRVAEAADGGAPLPPEDPATRPLWALSFRQHLFGQRALVEGRPRAALLRLCLDWLVARAHPEGERAGHVLAARRLDMPWQPVHRLLVSAESALNPVLDALPSM